MLTFDSSGNNKKIAKNTLYLYARMGVLMLIQLYTSRVILQTLGIDDFGLWGVVASISTSFSFITAPLVSATQRFLNFELGCGGNKLHVIFSTSLILFFIVGTLIFILLEVVGVWFLNTYVNIVPERIVAANWIFQFSIFSIFINFIRMPYESSIIAYERLSFYAIICILEAILKLLIVFSLLICHTLDNLILYGLLTFISTILMSCSYKLYCAKYIPFTKFHFEWNTSLARQIASFFGWNLYNTMAVTTSFQGLNILLNIFFGVSVNAAYSIATQVSNAVNQFVVNFQIAYNPQLVKSFAARDWGYLYQLIFRSSKFSYFLLFAVVCPLALNLNFILRLWLGTSLPVYTEVFCVLMLLYALFDAFCAPLWTAIRATGDIRNFELAQGTLKILTIVFSYFFLKCGFGPLSVLLIKICIEVFCIINRLFFAHKMLKLSVVRYVREVLLPISVVSCVTLFVVCALRQLVEFDNEWLMLMFSCVIFGIVFIGSVWSFGLDRSDRNTIKLFVLKKL